ncbi:MAG: ABC transporter ATP-binding protein [Burkholderiales bacterium]|nr:ABC transporter ATP-binding protein [Burkholderiales bacterium]
MIRAAPRAVVHLDRVTKTYASGTRALEPVSLTVAEGELVTLLGPSGCGKSTLLGIVAALTAPSTGAVRWWGEGPERIGAAGHRLAMVFQSATLMPWARVASNVCLPLDLVGMPRAEATRAVQEALARVGLAGFASSYPRELSGGMQMRASIARALVTEPDLLLMDEPFGALDEITRARLDAELLGLWAGRGTGKRLTIVFVTHSIYEAVYLSQRVVVLSARPGRVLGEVAVDEPYPRSDAFRVSQRFADRARAVQELLVEAAAGAAEAAGTDALR